MATQTGERATNVGTEVLISADSHVMEPTDLWETRLPAGLREKAPRFAPRAEGRAHGANSLNDPRPGGWNPSSRVDEMARDGVSAEVLYPTLGLRLYAIEDPSLQEACFGVYNDWLIEYCASSPERLVGIGLTSLYDTRNAVAELRRCRSAGLRGALVWQVPPAHLPFMSNHYDPFWAAAQDLDMPVSLHILTGFDYSRNVGNLPGLEEYRGAVNLKLAGTLNALFEIIFSGVLERFPKLKLVVVETEIGWIPFVLQQWDYYFERFRRSKPLPIDKLPSEYFGRQVYATFFNDAVGGKLLESWGEDNCMWSTDYPHANSTWPHSRRLLNERLGHLSAQRLEKLVRGNVCGLYDLQPPRALEGADG